MTLAPKIATPERLTGRTRDHLVSLDDGSIWIHADLAGPFRSLQAEARHAGFDPKIVSGFRDFDTQLRIWNEKVSGKRPLLDADSEPLDVHALKPREIIDAILRWSALPGASRHHWGTDVDVIDARALVPGYRVALVPEEFEGSGPFAPLHVWLDQHLSRFGFFRPYREDRGGVSPERWHLSYAPIASLWEEALTIELLERVLEGAEMALKKEVLDRLPDLFELYVENISPVV